MPFSGDTFGGVFCFLIVFWDNFDKWTLKKKKATYILGNWCPVVRSDDFFFFFFVKFDINVNIRC
jgi:hypothetical protein